MTRITLRLALPLFALSSLAALGCEHDEAPKPEAIKPVPVVSQAPAAATAAAPVANIKAGGCGMQGEVQEQGGGCGQAKDEAPGGCGCAGKHTGKDTDKAGGPVVPVTQAKLGDRTRCPVTNSVFIVRGDSPKADHAGKTYHFCCDGCVTRFKKDPKQFLET
jgi:hypothetical protein